ncbi:MAG: formylglycine-generating enzyme family protein, partial [Methylococcales bacterium]
MTVGTPRKGQLSRSDLLEATATDDLPATHYLAQQLGLERRSEERVNLTNNTDSSEQVTGSTQQTIESEQTLKPSMGFWRLERREITVQQQADDQIANPAVRLGWSKRPQIPPVFHPITAPSALLPRLLHHLKDQRKVRAIDADAVVKKLGRGEYLQRIPRLSRRSLGRHLLVIEDRHLHLTPYWRDQTLFAQLLASYLPEYASSHAILLEDRNLPQSVSSNDQLEDWIMPPDNSIVVVFSDLGALSENAASQVQNWLAIGRVLQKQGCKLLAVIPCHVDLCDPRLRALYTLVPWESQRQLVQQDLATLRTQADQLLTLLAPVVRLEPELLRSVRLALFRNQINFNASVEALVWQHADLLEPSSVAATFSSAARKRWLTEFRDIAEPVKQTVLDAIRPWRAFLQEQVWFEEITSLDESSRLLLPKSDLDDANDYFQYLSQQHAANDLQVMADVETQQWFKRVEKRLPQQSKDLSEVGGSLQRITHQIHQDDKHYHAEFPIDPANLVADDLPKQTMTVYQQGEQLIAQFNSPNTQLEQTSSRLAELQFRNGLLYIKTLLATRQPQHLHNYERSGQQIAVDYEQSVMFQTSGVQMTDICTLPDVPGLMLRSDEETLYFSQLQRPQWATNLARDCYGLYLEVDIKGIIQRFRWIEPATFLMGSPTDKPGRDDYEDQHQVTLTHGFWLADSAVTQVLWQAVMESNPSEFDDNLKNPVENISWQDVQQFISRLNQLIPDAQAQLPTEAQWEYACRAGTTTPFSFGDNISSEQVNYDGTRPYANGKEGKYRKQTVPVKSLPVNPWGLYEMHGNVWEWC